MVGKHRQEYGLNTMLKILDLSKGTWHYRTRKKIGYGERYGYLKTPLMEIAKDHSGYGYRRIKPELQERYGCRVNHKVIQRLLKTWELVMARNTKRPKPSGIKRAIRSAGLDINLLRKILETREPGILEVLVTDFSELVYAQGTKKMQFMPIVDYRTKTALGWALGKSANTEMALAAWVMAKGAVKSLGNPIKGIIVHHDQDPVYTGYRWGGRLLIEDEARLSFTENGAKDNTAMESFFGRFKEENRSLFLDAQTPTELKSIVKERIRYYNTQRRHSSLGNIPPIAYFKRMRKHQSNQRTD